MENFKRNTGIHTFEIQCGLTYEQFLAVKDALYSISCDMGSRCFPQNNFLKCTAFSDHGLTVFFSSRLLKLTVNPSCLLNSSDILGLYHLEKYSTSLLEMLLRLIRFLELFLPENILPTLSISRADYTIDTFLPSDEHVLLMIKLAKKNGLPKGFRETYPAKYRMAPDWNNSASYNVSRKDGSFCVNLYSKHVQLSASRKNIPADILEQSEGLLRTEISCAYPQNVLPFWQEETFSELFDPENLFSVYEDILPKLFPYGTYLKSSAVKDKIEKEYKNQRTWKKHLLNFLDIVIKYHSFHDAYKRFNNKNILKSDLLDAFYSIDVNPVTIAINDKISILPSIYAILGLKSPLRKQTI